MPAGCGSIRMVQGQSCGKKKKTKVTDQAFICVQIMQLWVQWVVRIVYSSLNADGSSVYCLVLGHDHFSPTGPRIFFVVNCRMAVFFIRV